MHAVLAHRAEQRIGEAAVAAAADHEQVRAGCGVEQDLRRMAAHDLAPDQPAVGWPGFLADRRVEPLPGVFGEVASLFHPDRRPAVVLQHQRDLPGDDGVDRAAGEPGLPDGPAQGRPRRRGTIDPHHDPGRAAC
jgi:hypothetical protein